MTENVALEKIYKASLKFLVPLTPEETYSIIVEEAVKLVGAEYGSVILDQEGELVRVYSSSPLAYKTKNRKKGFTYRAFSERKVIMAQIEETSKAHPELKEVGIRWTMFIPLSYQSKSIGVLTVNSAKNEQLNKKELKILELFGSMASLAIRKTQLYSETMKALETRDLFISMAAHELRTPITTIYGYAQLLHNKTMDDRSVESRWIDELHTESYRLTLLVNDLLAINRIKAGQLQYVLKECSLKRIIERGVRNFKFNHPYRVVLINDELGKKSDLVVGDFDRLLQVLINLLDNAAKFSPSDSDITINLKFKSPYLILSVTDKGKGISKKELPRVFEGFYKGRDPSKEGMGLGLFLAKNIIDQHHGSISIHSRINKGTTVNIHLPWVKI
jgi:signal transduction histidine kinase